MSSYTSSVDSRGFSITINYTVSGDTISGITFALNATNNNFSNWTLSTYLKVLDSSGSVVATLWTDDPGTRQYTVAKNSSVSIVGSGRTFTATSSGNYKIKAYVDAITDASYVPNQTTATTGNLALTVGSPATQNSAPTISGSGIVGTDVTATAGTYSNATSVSTYIAYATSSLFSGQSGSYTTSPHTVTSNDAAAPAYYFAAYDVVVGADGNTQYFYSTSTVLATAQTSYSATFSASGVSGYPQTLSGTSGSSITAPTPSSSTSLFNNWSRSSGSTSPSTLTGGQSFSISENVSYTATWKYQIDWNANGGSVSPSQNTPDAGSSITVPTPIKSGSVFNGWTLSTGTGPSSLSAGQSFTPSANAGYLANWTTNPTAPSPTLNGSFPNASINTTYIASITGSNFTSASATGLPTGLSLAYSGSNITISGTPTVAGTYSTVVTATNAPSGYTPSSTSQTFTIKISNDPTATVPTITGTITNTATTGTNYSQSITVTDYTSTAISAGSLPPGLSLSNVTISGTPTTVGVYTFTIKAINAPAGYVENSSEKTYTITVSNPPAPTPTFSTTLFSDGYKNTAYSSSVAISNATSITISKSNGVDYDIPAGMTFSFSGGILTISGTCTIVQAYAFTVTATNVISGYTTTTSTKTYIININDLIATQPSFTDIVVRGGRVGVPYTDGVSATPITSYSLAYPSGETQLLSDYGLSFNTATGAITGTPSKAGSITFVITATNAPTGFTPASYYTPTLQITISNAFMKVYASNSFIYANAVRVRQNGAWIDAQVKVYKNGTWVYPS